MAARRKKRKGKGRTGEIGNEIYAQVESLVAGEKISRSAAFRRLSEKTGRKSGTVAANYYRVARQKGGGGLRRRRRGPGRPPGVGRGARRGRLANASRALSVLNELTSLIRNQAAEIVRLQRENARFTEIRRLLAKA